MPKVNTFFTYRRREGPAALDFFSEGGTVPQTSCGQRHGGLDLKAAGVPRERMQDRAPQKGHLALNSKVRGGPQPWIGACGPLFGPAASF
jgi:hypothetical protein